ncbi:antibiotic biosynthesis monooxygenase [Roseibium salinum]|uniref:Antibiotic biosynthesis monooxygenase n=1 Tax=Roseibium salinum TaxID=1604349 RepID=A0ABT3R3D7_9HYPH|nr:antibiotic biosynthesis monooxygenase [Roseibium sp. DSM 29163]MCX2723689.1 antibiotic biosynthesis monooxygenase [Roseibium sp. DSM 29163]
MIKRIWHGWTTLENAATYLEVLTTQVIPGIEAKNIPGFLGIEVLRRELADEVEFLTIMSFRSLNDVGAFQGADYERCYVPDVARSVLKRWDEVSQHYELKDARSYE